jgi:hypothetical protein
VLRLGCILPGGQKYNASIVHELSRVLRNGQSLHPFISPSSTLSFTFIILCEVPTCHLKLMMMKILEEQSNSDPISGVSSQTDNIHGDDDEMGVDTSNKGENIGE